ncbi:MAG: (2Fe-2S)-binding protein [Desulfomonile tiedjei]|nr:(2Fe-2S)-binding protein [Desulfomonile tiedjei]
MIETLEFRLNDRQTRLTIDTGRPLLWVLRSNLGLTGTKYGCGIGTCGACTILLNKEAVRSCQVPVNDIKGKEVLTIEGLAKNGRLHPLQKAFVEHDALQCGFCTPGMILNAYSLILRKPAPTEADIIGSMDDNLCRCGAHQRIIRAIQTAAKQMRE